MLQRFLQQIKKHAPFSDEDILVLAVSGGVDSMVLWYLIESTGQPYIIAHCNFGLRGEESDGDEAMVREKALALGRSVFVKSFDTEQYAKEKQISIQMAARELRYAWFKDLMIQEGATKLLTAHHLNDNVETVLLNQVRGTSILGLSGIAYANGEVIRPLLSFSKEEMHSFAKQEQLDWREDSSNTKTDYKRNFIRQEVIPPLAKLNPNLLHTFSANIKKNQEVETLFLSHVSLLKDSLLRRDGEKVKLSIQALIDKSVQPLAFQHVLNEYGFNYDQAESILGSLAQSGKSFETKSHKLWIDRQALIIERLDREYSVLEHEVNNWDELEDLLTEYNFSLLKRPFSIDRSSENLMLDLDKLAFPLTLRTWKQGDKIKPLGMTNQKLVSDLLIDSKIPVPLKSQVKILISSHKIAAVVGVRVSEDFKVEESTSQAIHAVKVNLK